jgi:Tol biopolymer transport system component
VQLTNDPQFFDEEPLWSHDGSHILFCRTDAHDARTIWMMREDGSEARQVAGPLRQPPAKYWHHGFYGYTDWRSLFNWWQA